MQEPEELDSSLLTPTPRGPPPWVPSAVLGVLLVASLSFNGALWSRVRDLSARPPPAPAAPPPPAAPECPTCPTCAPPAPAPECPVCPAPPEPTAGAGTGTATAARPSTPRPPPPPRIDADAAAEGEAHVAAASNAGERDPVHLAAQRRMTNAVDRIVDSRSPEAAERFLRRNLPGIAAMDCAFRDPAMAEHVRVRLRELNNTARPANRLSDADLARFERDLRCPRE